MQAASLAYMSATYAMLHLHLLEPMSRHHVRVNVETANCYASRWATCTSWALQGASL